MKRKNSGKANALTTPAPQPITRTVLPTEEKWLTTAEIIRDFKVSERTLLRLRNKGILPVSKLGGTVLYPCNLVNKILMNKMQNKVLFEDDHFR